MHQFLEGKFRKQSTHTVGPPMCKSNSDFSTHFVEDGLLLDVGMEVS